MNAIKSAILQNGTVAPSKSLVLCLSQVADESFTRCVDVTLDELPALPEGWKFALDTAIALKMKGCCDPHSDEYHGPGEPAETASFFWLLRDTSSRPTYLMAGEDNLSMHPGDWAVFDDGRQHALLNRGTWTGLAIQVYR